MSDAKSLGELFALFEYQQKAILPFADVVSRLFPMAVTRPARAFTLLARGGKNYERKMKGVYLKRLIDAKSSEINNIPEFLSIFEQAEFVLGYHQQRNELFKKKNENNGNEKENESDREEN